MRDWEALEWFLLTLGVIAGLFILSIPIDCARVQHSTRYGTVIQASYVPASTSTGVGTGVSPGGQVVVMPVTTSSPASFMALVDINGYTEDCSVPKQLFQRVKPGARVKIHTTRSFYFSGDVIEEVYREGTRE